MPVGSNNYSGLSGQAKIYEVHQIMVIVRLQTRNSGYVTI